MENGGYETVEMKATSKTAEAEDSNYDYVVDDAEQGEPSETKEKSVKLCTKPFAGMGKEDLLKFSQTKGWRAARWVCLLIIFAGWCAMLGMAIFLIVTTPRCLPWWQSTAIYQIFPRSFQDTTLPGDSGPDGVGDLRGIIQRVNYIESLGVRAVMLSSIYRSGGMDNGEDVIDFSNIDDVLGDMTDFIDLTSALHERDIKLILDFIPNHSSDRHEFFNESRRVGEDGVDPKYQDYYTWADEDFTNWVSLYSGSAWQCNPADEQCYLHQFSEYQPDLNLDNEDVRAHLSQALETWFTRGVDGFNIRGVKYFDEAKDVRNSNEPVNPDYVPNESDLAQYDQLLHYYTSEYMGRAHELLQSWKDDVFYKFSTAGTYRLMMTDSDSNTTYVQNYYGEADLPMNYNLLKMGDPEGNGKLVTGVEIETLIKDWLDEMNDENWPNFQLGNYATRRIASRLNPRYSKVSNMLLLTLPGTPICYYGDEIGMEDVTLDSFDQVKDRRALNDEDVWELKTRDPQRSPMQWNSSVNAGFSISDDIYLPVHAQYAEINVAAQDEDDNSVLNMFRRMMRVRSDYRALTSRGMTFIATSNEVISYVREIDNDNSRFFVALNFGEVNSEEDYYETSDESMMPLQGTVMVATEFSREGTRVELNKLFLSPGEGLVILLDEIVFVGESWWYKYFRPSV